MNFVQQLEESLRDLAAEARKKHPGVKEASERAQLQLRKLQNAYIQQVRQANQCRLVEGSGAGAGGTLAPSSDAVEATATIPVVAPPTTALFASSELLHPFLLAANYPNASQSGRLLDISLQAMQLLLAHNAILKSDGIHMVRVWMIQAQVITGYYEKQYGLLSLEVQHQQQKQQQQQQQQQKIKPGTTPTSDDDDDSSSSSPPAATHHATPSSSSSSSSWFGWGSSSSSTTSTTTSHNSKASSRTRAAASVDQSTTHVPTTTVKNAVSSSGGGVGSGSGSSGGTNPAWLDRTAKEILSCLLQLLQFLLKDDDNNNNNNNDDNEQQDSHSLPSSDATPPPLEFWTNATALAVVWLPVLPCKHTVHQAARSTVLQILHGLFAAAPPSSVTSSLSVRDWQVSTWEDLLHMVLAPRSTTAPRHHHKLSGAFALCKHLPQRPLALEVLVQIGEQVFRPNSRSSLTTTTTQLTKASSSTPAASFLDRHDALITKTLGVCMSLLRETNKTNSAPTNNVDLWLRVVQWTSQLFAALQATHPSECTELLTALVQPIAGATETCRSLHDFEDGFVYAPLALSSSMGAAALPAGSNTSAAHTASAASTVHHGAASAAHPAASSQTVSCLVPGVVIWKASLTLEAVYAILERPVDQLSSLLDAVHVQSYHLIATVSETLSDFATILASCQDHILLLASFAESVVAAADGDPWHGSSSSVPPGRAGTTPVPFKPTLLRRAENAVVSGNSHVFEESLQRSIYTTITTTAGGGVGGGVRSSGGGASAATAGGSSNVLGEALWIALQGILRIIDCIGVLQQHKDDEDKASPQSNQSIATLLEDVFAPTMAVLQHYLKRFVGSPELVQLTLTGYSSLANICIPLGDAAALQRKALLTSLCKLSLPNWGLHRDKLSSVSSPYSQLQDHHIRALTCLFRIIHAHHDSLSQEWDTVLWTCEELADLPIASSQLSDEAYHAALAVSAVLCRFASFTTCFSRESLLRMAEALADIAKSAMSGRDVVGDSDTVVPQRPAALSVDSLDGRETFGEKIMNMGVRAIYGGGNVAGSDKDRAHSLAAVAERTRNSFYEDYRRDFVTRVSTTKTAVRVGSIGRLPFSLALLTDVLMANSFRWQQCGDSFSALLSGLAAASPVVRPYAMDVMSMLTMSHVSNERSLPVPFVGPGRLVFADPMQSQLWAVERVPSTAIDEQAPAVATDTAQSQLLSPICRTLKTTVKADVAESSLGALVSILEGVGHNLEGSAWADVIDAVASLSGDPSYHVDRTSAEWSSCCLVAFRCLKFIVDDFLDQLATSKGSGANSLFSLLECCSSFGRSRHDVNTSLTAIGLLWTIADQDSGSSSIDLALSKLVQLASDQRQEVRNAAVNTLFSCIVGRGGTFSDERWESCFSECIYAVYNLVLSGGVNEPDGTKSTKPSRFSVARHHSTDSNSKLWVSTQVLVLRGLIRVLRHYFGQLVDATDTGNEEEPWFQDAWVRILDFAFAAATQPGLRDTLDIRSAGVELLVICCQLSSKAGIQALSTQAKVGTNMEVVNGALRSVRENHATKNTYQRSSSLAVEASRSNLFLEAFDGLESYAETITNSQGTDAVDDTMLQILYKFAVGLGHLFECCKDYELVSSETIQALESPLHLEQSLSAEDDELATRFVRIVTTTLNVSSIETKSRFLNQAQRASLTLLNEMAVDGSIDASRQLVVLSGASLFLSFDDDQGGVYEPTETTNDEPPPSPVCVEARKLLSDFVAKESVRDLCKGVVLHDALLMYSRRCHVETPSAKSNHQPLFYRPMCPIVVNGLGSLRALQSDTARPLVNSAWALLLRSLSVMMTPVVVTGSRPTIPHVADLTLLINAARTNLIAPFEAELGSIFARCASQSYDIAGQWNDAAVDAADDGKIRERRTEHLLLFQLCFGFSLSLSPHDPLLRAITEHALSQALLPLSQPSSEESCSDDFRVTVGLETCRIIRDSSCTEDLVTSVFPQLCKVMASDHKALRASVSAILEKVQIADRLKNAQARCDDAELRATTAETRVTELSHRVDELKKENLQLKKDVAVLEASVV